MQPTLGAQERDLTMPELHPPTEFSMRGPWLLSREVLLSLDSALDEEWERISARREALVAEHQSEASDRYLPYELKRSSKGVTLTLKSGAEFVSDSFAQALRDPSIASEVPVGFSASLEAADVRFKLSTSRWNDALQLTATPSDNREAQEALVLLSQWMRDHCAPLWQRIWSRLSGLQWFAWWLLLFVALSVIGAQSSPGERLARARARDLIDAGINSANINEAVQLMLSLQMDYYPNAGKVMVPQWVGVTILGGLAVSIVLSFRPRIVLGIGRGEQIIRRWRVWLRIIGVVVPTFLFSGVAGPALIDILKSVF